MFKFIFIIALFFSPHVFSGSYYFGGVAAFWSNEGGISGGDVCGATIEACVANMPKASYISSGSRRYATPTGTSSHIGSASYYVYYARDDNGWVNKMQVSFSRNVEDGNVCSSNDECFALANLECESINQVLSHFSFKGVDKDPVYTSSCSDLPPDPADECEQNIVQQCTSHLGMASSTFTEDGLGGSSCFGTCNDGTDAQESCIETLANHYCDVVEPPSELDFGAGGTGSSVDPSQTTAEDAVNDIPYEADGTTADADTGFSTLQGDKLINEVVKSRNDNTTNLASTSETTNQTIVEKSDDISNTVSNSANGIIDAINDIAPFYDGNIVNSLDGLGDKIDLIDDKLDGLTGPYDTTPTESGTYESLFDVGSIDAWKTKINILKVDIDSEMRGFEFDLKNTMSFTTTANGYAPNNLDLGQWGAHDISLSRFADYFGGVGNIIYFLASLTALSIALGGIKL